MANAVSLSDPANTWTSRALAAIAASAGLAYLAWRTTTLGSGSRLWLSIPLFVTELWAYAGFGSLAAASWARPSQADRPAADADSFPLVAAIVDGRGATVDQLERTLVGLSALRGLGRVTVRIDDGDTELAQVAARFGATASPVDGSMLDRLGNLDTPLGLWLTAGQVVMPDLLERTVPRFDDAQVATCQVAVSWLNADSLAHMRGGSDQDALVRHVVGPSLSARGAAPWVGPGSLVRTAAIRPLAEAESQSAAHARMALLTDGWQAVFEPNALVRGIAPDTLADYLQSRRAQTAETRRVVGALRRAPRAARLGPIHQLLAASAGLRQLLQLALLCIVILTGVLPFTATAGAIATWWLTVATLRSLARSSIAAGSMSPTDWTRQAWRTLPADAAAFFGRPIRPASDDHRLGSTLGTLWPLSLAMLAIDAALLARGWTLVEPDALPRLATNDRVLVLLWGLAFLAPLADVVIVTTLRRQRRTAPRLETSLPITVGDAETRTVDVSPGGVGLLLDAAPSVGSLAAFELTLPALDGGASTVEGAAHVRSATPDASGRVRVGLEFANLSAPARVALVGYCSVGHAVEFVHREPPVLTPASLESDSGAGRRPVRGVTGLAVVAGIGALLAGPSAGVAFADDTIPVEQVCVAAPDGDPVPGAVVSRLTPGGEELVGTSDATGCLPVATSTTIDAYRAVLGGVAGTASTSAAEGSVLTITLAGRSVLVLDAAGAPLEVELRTFTDGWSEPITVTGRTTLPPDPDIEAIEVRWADTTHVRELDADIVVVLALLLADDGVTVTEIDRGAGWEAFTDGMQVLPGRIAVRLDDGTVAKLEVPGDHEMRVPSGTIRRLDLAPQPTPIPVSADALDPPPTPSVEPTAPPEPTPVPSPTRETAAEPTAAPTSTTPPTPVEEPTATAEPTVTVEPSPTEAPSPTAVPAEPTPTPDATPEEPTPTAEAPTSTPTVEPTPTPTPTTSEDA